MSVSEKKVGEGQGQRTVTRVTFVWLGLYGTSRDRIPNESQSTVAVVT